MASMVVRCKCGAEVGTVGGDGVAVVGAVGKGRPTGPGEIHKFAGVCPACKRTIGVKLVVGEPPPATREGG